jgi:hypothetical protein
MRKKIGVAAAFVLLVFAAASPGFASQYLTGSRYLQVSGGRTAPISTSTERKGKRESKPGRDARDCEMARPAWHELLMRIF